MDHTRHPRRPAAAGDASGPDFFDPGHPRDRTPWDTVTGRVIAVVSRKGGVGKTTSAVNLAAAFALSGHSVLIVGVDSQCGVCRTLGCRPEELQASLSDLFGENANLTDLAHRSPLDGLWFVSPRVLSLADEEELVRNLETRMGLFVHEIDRARNLYDTIIIDCPPGLGAATRAALLAADSYLIPVQAEELCRESVADLVEFVDEFRARHELGPGEAVVGAAARPAGTPLALEGMFLTMVSERTRAGRHVTARVAEDYGDLLLETRIPRTTRLAEMALRGRPAVIYDRRSAGSRAYFDLADELVRRYCLNRRRDASDPAKAALLTGGEDTAGEQPEDVLMATASPGTLNRFERFLLDLAGPEESWRAPGGDEPLPPEMVSLEDLLAEEDQDRAASDRPWDERYWSFEGERHDRIN